MYILYILQTLATPKPTTRKTSLADVIPDWPELKPFRQKKQVSCSKQKVQDCKKKSAVSTLASTRRKIFQCKLVASSVQICIIKTGTCIYRYMHLAVHAFSGTCIKRYRLVEFTQFVLQTQSKRCMIRAVTTLIVYTFSRTVQSGYPVQRWPSTFSSTNGNISVRF